jgi:hypothetical protein
VQAGLDPCWSQTLYVDFYVMRLIYASQMFLLLFFKSFLMFGVLLYFFTKKFIGQVPEPNFFLSTAVWQLVQL